MSNREIFAEFTRYWIADQHSGLDLKVCCEDSDGGVHILMWGLGPDMNRVVCDCSVFRNEIETYSSQDMWRLFAVRIDEAIRDMHEAGLAVVPMMAAVERVKGLRQKVEAS